MNKNVDQNESSDEVTFPSEAESSKRVSHGVGSVSTLISQLKSGDEDSVRVLWNRYSEALIRAAQKTLGGQSPAKIDPEALAQSVFFAVYRGAINEQFDCLNDRTGFWTLVLAITKHKAIDLIRKETSQKRGGGASRQGEQARSEGAPAYIETLPSRSPSPEIETDVDDLFEHLKNLLDVEDPSGILAQVAVSRIAGHSVTEIAAAMERTERTVERKLERIRAVWTEQCGLD